MGSIGWPNLTLNRHSREVRRGTKVISLTRQEFDLLEFLMSNPDKALSRVALLEHVWGYHYDTLTNVVDVYIGYLRKKIADRSKKQLIQTVRNFGYKIADTRPPNRVPLRTAPAPFSSHFLSTSHLPLIHLLPFSDRLAASTDCGKFEDGSIQPVARTADGVLRWKGTRRCASYW